MSTGEGIGTGQGALPNAGSKMRIYELAKELGLANKDLVAKVQALGIEAKNHMSNLEVEDVQRVKNALNRERQANLVEERLSATVIRRRTKDGTSMRAPAATPVAAAQATTPVSAEDRPRRRVVTPETRGRDPVGDDTSARDDAERDAERILEQQQSARTAEPATVEVEDRTDGSHAQEPRSPEPSPEDVAAMREAAGRSSGQGGQGGQDAAASALERAGRDEDHGARGAEARGSDEASGRSDAADAGRGDERSDEGARGAEANDRQPSTADAAGAAGAAPTGPGAGEPIAPRPTEVPVRRMIDISGYTRSRQGRGGTSTPTRVEPSRVVVETTRPSASSSAPPPSTTSVAASASAAGAGATASASASGTAIAPGSAAPAVDKPVVPEKVKLGPTGRVIELPSMRQPIIQVVPQADTRGVRDLRDKRDISGRDRFARSHQGKKKAQVGKKQKQTQITTPAAHKRVVKMEDTATVAELAKQMSLKATDVLKKLWGMGMTGITLNSSIDADAATLVAQEFGYEVENIAFQETDVFADSDDAPEDLVLRAPVVTIMGHVDHGKTSLLDAIRNANVAAGEAGGITQHIGAYKVAAGAGDVVFLDTPGHEAFTAMRARGAQATDIVVLVVAADDGVMPTTIEALNHAKEAEVTLIVAVNKIDKANAQPERVRQQLSEYGLISEAWGGETIFVDISARNKVGIDKLLEMLALQAEVLELKANPNKLARGVVIEGKLDRNRGPVATILVQEGTLKLGDTVVAGEQIGKVRAMLDDKGRSVSTAGPSTPIEVLGLSGVPGAGENFNAASDEKQAKELVEHRRDLRRKKELAGTSKVSLENIMDKIREGAVKELKIVLKADVHGSSEALKDSLIRLGTDAVKVDVISSGVGGITESDVNLAKAGNALIVGFHVRPAGKAAQLAEQEQVEIKLYDIIYEALDDVKKAMAGLLPPVKREKPLGKAEVRQVFVIPKLGTIGGCSILDGVIRRSAQARIVRAGTSLFQGKITSLRRFKEDVREVTSGYECGIGLEGWNDLQEGDVIEAFEIEEIAPTL